MITDQNMLEIAVAVARFFELLGIAVIVIGAFIAIVKFISNLVTGHGAEAARERDLISRFRRTLGRSILTGLELLVAADIIRTVAVDPTLESVLVLGLIVIIRTFLSFSLEVEIDGKWPWQKGKPEN